MKNRKTILITLIVLSLICNIGCRNPAPDIEQSSSSDIEQIDPFVSPIVWQSVENYSTGWKGPIELRDGTILSTRMNPGSPLSGQKIMCVASSDGGFTFNDLGVIATEDSGVDFGDPAMAQLSNGTILCSYRYNRYNYPTQGKSKHEIRMSKSVDGGKTWEFHSIVSENEGNSPGFSQVEQRGLWSQYILETSRGDLQCYYDDENICWESGYRGHQWWMMKTYNAESGEWENPVAVSRTSSPTILARDGQGCVQEIEPGVLVSVCESVRTAPPNRGCVRITVSYDYGKTWSWEDENGADTRRIVYVPEDKNYSTLCPWLTKLPNNVLLCSFMTDEDREKADHVASGVLDQSIKYCLSFDGGVSWSDPYMLDDRHPLWAPGIILMTKGPNAGKLLYQATLVTNNGNAVVRKIGRLNLPEF